MTDDIIKTVDLTKKYSLKGDKKEILALNKVNISIKAGEIFGLLGPNGAGKTTLISILTTLMQPTSGYAYIDGLEVSKNPRKVRNKFALMLESDMLYYRVTGYDNLKFFCKLHRVPNYAEKIIEKAKIFGLENWLNQYVERYSSGMKMKLALLRTILLERKILFLDEPTLGLDVKTINLIITELKKLGATIFITSHDMNVVEKLCNRLAFINKGNILKLGDKSELKGLMQTEVKVEVRIQENQNTLKTELNQRDFIKEITDIQSGLLVVLKSRDHYNEFLKILNNYKVLMVKENEISLEELFMKLM